jgi:hypothetical protein
LRSAEYKPFEWYEATYIVPGVIGTGLGKLTCCHPLPDSPVNVAMASSVPSIPHSRAICVPVSEGFL